MKNDNHPLLMALKKRSPNQPSRFMDLKTSEVGTSSKPGDSVRLNISGTIKSIDDEGRVVLSIEGVSNGSENQEESQEDKTLRVVTQQSHA